ncbi:gem-associated protein 8 [Biomphalaria glabrata]|nr:gem-associated protein 8 [Biomphalaria glabrata]
MEEKGKSNTGSITSVTEEEETSSDSDTTESYTNITSSLLSSTDTDDKLTPDLINISISKPAKQMGNAPKRRKKCNTTVISDVDIQKADICGYPPALENVDDFLPRSESTGFIFPYGSSPLPLGKLDNASVCSHPEEEFPRHERKILVAHSSSTASDKSSGADNSEDKFGTHCSDNSNSNANGDSSTVRPYLPNWTCAAWYQARCFDHYWKHYNFVMAWYRQHISSVRLLHSQIGMVWPSFPQSHHCCANKKRRRNGSARRRKHHKNIQKRKKAQKASSSSRSRESLSDLNERKNVVDERDSKSDSNEEEEDIEMEITEEMAQFIKTSMMHKLERDNIKKNVEETREEETSIKIASCQPNPTTSAPVERPGARRAAELKDLYGNGAAMIHGMETALQMTYDRDLDRLKPKLWPNMPLRIVFS